MSVVPDKVAQSQIFQRLGVIITDVAVSGGVINQSRWRMKVILRVIITDVAVNGGVINQSRRRMKVILRVIIADVAVLQPN